MRAEGRNQTELVRPPIWPRLRGWYQRNAARTFFARPVALRNQQPIISFTFDDFPRSAWLAGGAILEQFGLRGTYYASFGLMGKIAPTGAIFEADDARALVARGHELGCHTFAHCPSWETRTTEFERSIAANQAALDRLIADTRFRSFSYPIGPPRPRTKRVVGRTFACARGGGQSINAGTIDLSYLRAYFLEKAKGDPAAIARLIEANESRCGWLIFATHDVSDQPTPFGCRPEFFEATVRYAVGSGAHIVPVAEALTLLTHSQ